MVDSDLCVVSDLFIVVPFQKEALIYEAPQIQTQADLRDIHSPPQFALKSFQVLQAIMGMWYTIYPDDAHIYTDAFFDLESDSSAQGNDTVILRNKWTETIFNTLKYYLDHSPNQLLAVMIRLDYPHRELVHSPISYSAFTQKLLSNQIKFDELYYIVP